MSVHDEARCVAGILKAVTAAEMGGGRLAETAARWAAIIGWLADRNSVDGLDCPVGRIVAAATLVAQDAMAQLSGLASTLALLPEDARASAESIAGCAHTAWVSAGSPLMTTPQDKRARQAALAVHLGSAHAQTSHLRH